MIIRACCSTGLLVGVSLTAWWAPAQQVISTRSGLVHHSEGIVTLHGQPPPPRGQFAQMKPDSVLRTADGRAEVLLTPGAFLRVGENSSIRMVSSRLSDTRLELLEGSILVECIEMRKDNAITLTHKEATISLYKKGLYRLDSEPALVRVFEGEAEVESGGQRLIVKGGNQAALVGVLSAQKFKKSSDTLHTWSRRRGRLLADANRSAAAALRDTGAECRQGDWRWDPTSHIFTFLPCGMRRYSPFGYVFLSLSDVRKAKTPRRTKQATSAAQSTSGTGTTSKTSVRATPSSEPSSPAAGKPPITRESQAGGKGR